MAELHLNGYLCEDDNNIIALSDTLGDEYNSYSIIKSIESFANECGMVGIHHKRLGGTICHIDNCNMRIWFTNKECTLEEAMEAMDELLYGGDIKTKVDKVGYSEWTICGLRLDEFTLGGHNMDSILRDHMKEYCHIIIEC